MRGGYVLVGLGAACTAGPLDVTRIEDVRVVAAIAEPPEVAVGETYALTAVVANPQGADVDVAVWQCAAEGPCDLAVERLTGDELALERAAPVGSPGDHPSPLWVLACADGACGDLGAVADADLRDPAAWLRRLPLAGVSAAAKQVPLTELPPELRRANPVITAVGAIDLDAVAPSDVRSVTLTAPGAVLAAGLATDGGFGTASVDVAADGEAALEWYAPDTAGSVDLYVVLDDGLGGSAVWRASATVAP